MHSHAAAAAVTLLAGDLTTTFNRGSATGSTSSAVVGERPTAWTCPEPTPTSGTPARSTWKGDCCAQEFQISSQGLNTLPLSNSQNDITKLVINGQVFENTGAKAIVMAPQETGAIALPLDQPAAKNTPVVSVDTRPDKGKVYMVVGADNRTYGAKACQALGKQLNGKEKLAASEGHLHLRQRP